MFGNPAAERAAIEMTYEDTASIIGTVSATGANCITKSAPTVKYDGIICALSQSGANKSQQNEAHEIEHDAVVFAAPELLVMPGDSITLKRFGRINPFGTRILTFKVIGRPAVYPTHQEIKVKDVDLA